MNAQQPKFESLNTLFLTFLPSQTKPNSQLFFTPQPRFYSGLTFRSLFFTQNPQPPLAQPASREFVSGRRQHRGAKLSSSACPQRRKPSHRAFVSSSSSSRFSWVGLFLLKLLRLPAINNYKSKHEVGVKHNRLSIDDQRGRRSV